MTTKASRWLAVLFAVAVVTGSSLPGSSLPDLGSHQIDKVLHFLQYAILGYLVTRGWGPCRHDKPDRLGTWLLVVLMVGFAALDEFHQNWIPGRSVEFWDWVADATGVIISFLLAVWVNRRMRSVPGQS